MGKAEESENNVATEIENVILCESMIQLYLSSTACPQKAQTWSPAVAPISEWITATLERLRHRDPISVSSSLVHMTGFFGVKAHHQWYLLSKSFNTFPDSRNVTFSWKFVDQFPGPTAAPKIQHFDQQIPITYSLLGKWENALYADSAGETQTLKKLKLIFILLQWIIKYL